MPEVKDFADWLHSDQDFRYGLFLLIRAGIEAENLKRLQAGPTEGNKQLLHRLIESKVVLSGTNPPEISVKPIAAVENTISVTAFRELLKKRQALYTKLNYYKDKTNQGQPGISDEAIAEIRKEIQKINQAIKPK